MVKKYNKKDPKRKQESQKYDHPVPSREYILQYMKERKVPVFLRDFLHAFSIKKEPEVDGFIYRLKAMLRDGQLHQNRKGAFSLSVNLKLVAGNVVGHPDGYGFVLAEDGKGDFFVPEKQMAGLFSGDRVLVRPAGKKHGRKREGKIIEILERNTQELVGRFHWHNGMCIVSPDNKRIPQDVIIAKEDIDGAQEGDYVRIEIIQQPTPRHSAMGQVIEVIGNELTPGMEIDLSIHNHGIPYVWPDAVLAEAGQYDVEINPADIDGRLDCRDLPFVTIDGEDARDFDDAVYCEPSESGWNLYVAIADVAHYVKVDSALDITAKDRGNSVYFPGRVVPMLPEVLSNELCSLKPEVDRLVMVVKVALDSAANVTSYEFNNAVIRSHQRFTYTKVATVLESQEQHQYLPQLNNLYKLYQLLLAQREKRGALDFFTTETRIIFNDKGKIEKIVPTERNEAHRIIEECMLVANVAAADFLLVNEIPSLFRNHDTPETGKLEQLRAFLQLCGEQLPGGDKPTPKHYSNLLAKIAAREDFFLIQTFILRSLQQAVYSQENKGHFGLAYDSYAHFTSPIRRYPDLLVHRAIKHLLSKKNLKKFHYDAQQAESMALHCSTTERRADLATREALDRLKCDFMKDKVGSIHEGVIVDVTNFGVFVELKDIYVQGLVHITSLKNDYYRFDEVKKMLIGKRGGATYTLNDEVKVLVSRVDLDERKIDFDLAD